MNHRHVLSALLITMTVGLAAGHLQAADVRPEQSDRSRPSVIIILTDDEGYADVGYQGLKDIPTPHMDALARSGVRCTNGYVSCPVCSPTRAGLATGRY